MLPFFCTSQIICLRHDASSLHPRCRSHVRIFVYRPRACSVQVRSCGLAWRSCSRACPFTAAISYLLPLNPSKVLFALSFYVCLVVFTRGRKPWRLLMNRPSCSKYQPRPATYMRVKRISPYVSFDLQGFIVFRFATMSVLTFLPKACASLILLYTSLTLPAPAKLRNRQTTVVPDFVAKYGRSTVCCCTCSG